MASGAYTHNLSMQNTPRRRAMSNGLILGGDLRVRAFCVAQFARAAEFFRAIIGRAFAAETRENFATAADRRGAAPQTRPFSTDHRTTETPAAHFEFRLRDAHTGRMHLYVNQREIMTP